MNRSRPIRGVLRLPSHALWASVVCFEQPLESLCPQLVGKLVQGVDVRQRETPLVQQGLALFPALSAAFPGENDADDTLPGAICSASERN